MHLQPWHLRAISPIMVASRQVSQDSVQTCCKYKRRFSCQEPQRAGPNVALKCSSFFLSYSKESYSHFWNRGRGSELKVASELDSNSSFPLDRIGRFLLQSRIGFYLPMGTRAHPRRRVERRKRWRSKSRNRSILSKRPSTNRSLFD